MTSTKNFAMLNPKVSVGMIENFMEEAEYEIAYHIILDKVRGVLRALALLHKSEHDLRVHMRK